MKRTSAVIAGALLVGMTLSVAGVMGADAPPDEKPARIKIAAEKFGALKQAISEFNGSYKKTFEATVVLERLLRKKSDENGANSWRCASALETARGKCDAAKDSLRGGVAQAETTWKAAKGAATTLGPDERPWGDDTKAVDESVRRVRTLFTDVASAETSVGPKRLAAIWKRAQEYAHGLPKCLPSVKAESLIPDTVVVPCLHESVAVR